MRHRPPYRPVGALPGANLRPSWPTAIAAAHPTGPPPPLTLAVQVLATPEAQREAARLAGQLELTPTTSTHPAYDAQVQALAAIRLDMIDLCAGRTVTDIDWTAYHDAERRLAHTTVACYDLGMSWSETRAAQGEADQIAKRRSR